MILQESADISSLHTLICASPVYYEAFRSDCERLLSQVLLQELMAKGVYLWPTELHLPMEYGPQSVMVEWLEYRIRPGVDLTIDIRRELNSTCIMFYSHICFKLPLKFSVQQFKALRLLEDVLVWVRETFPKGHMLKRRIQGNRVSESGGADASSIDKL